MLKCLNVGGLCLCLWENSKIWLWNKSGFALEFYNFKKYQIVSAIYLLLLHVPARKVLGGFRHLFFFTFFFKQEMLTYTKDPKLFIFCF
jgi:hypothetical protein